MFSVRDELKGDHTSVRSNASNVTNIGACKTLRAPRQEKENRNMLWMRGPDQSTVSAISELNLHNVFD